MESAQTTVKHIIGVQSMIEAIVGIIGAAVLAVIGWAFMISNRVAVLEADKVSLKELIDSKLNDISRRLGRIEVKLDRNPETVA